MPVSVRVIKFFLITVDTARILVMHGHSIRSFQPTSHIVNMVIFLQERVSVKSDHLIRNPVRAKKVSHGFSYKQNDLEQSGSGIDT